MKEDKRNKRSRAFLVETLLELLEEKEYADISIKELTEKAGIARQTFYRNYQSMDDILLRQMDEIFDEYFETVKITLGGDGGEINAMMKKLFYIWQRNEPVFIALQKANLAYRPLERFSFYVSLIQRQIEDKAAIDDAINRYLACFIAGGTFMALNTWFQEHMHESIDELGGLFEKIMKFLIATIREYQGTVK